ncbi:hypothetical protein GCM10012280_58300 [Wenjunlia tyrosinilytica]|uniref:Uncharacterized protein n=1 Tax=Wenjunlia tyrosinilytica TaxID=1544741 RepID=A0A917ZWP1_9ACTN|nr:hypothetical protein GCM10012280_58300 [Wenjunlia tyrosinilytica]
MRASWGTRMRGDHDQDQWVPVPTPGPRRGDDSQRSGECDQPAKERADLTLRQVVFGKCLGFSPTAAFISCPCT